MWFTVYDPYGVAGTIPFAKSTGYTVVFYIKWFCATSEFVKAKVSKVGLDPR